MSHPTGSAPGSAAHAEHELSPWPPLIGLGLLVAYLGVVHGTIPLVIGIAIFFVAIGGWIRDDIRNWPTSPPDNVPGQKKAPEFMAMVLFLGTEVVVFGTLFAAWYNGEGRAIAQGLAWPPPGFHLDIPGTTINTVILLLSGLTCHISHLAIRRGNHKRFVQWMAATVVLGAIFLGLQVVEYQKLFAEGFGFTTNYYTTSFYMLTGTHGLHVAFGLLMLILVLVRGLMGQFTAEKHLAVEAFALYWHFVDLVWIVLYFVVYDPIPYFLGGH
ncbi:MAG TPA: heme-copper oxidase subunit III [Candidatus Thermoplasmatota archaeon]|nr:heme-copper oxidase subunit III [Candidatus Thermoplasmatota archaeon]